jgi:SAM-dependent methyltransferase
LAAPDPRQFEVDRALLHRGGAARAWGNLGDWTHARTYAEACEALAVRVGEAAGLRPGDEVLEAACGEGEGLCLWRERFGVEGVTGVELHPRSVEAARTRLAARGLEEHARVELGDAVDLSRFSDSSFDAVVCVDAAYHFAPRSRFVAEAVRTLRPGGRLALSDLVLHDEARGLVEAAAVRGAARVSLIPRENLLGESAYVAELTRAGLDEIRIVRLDAAVLLGFASFIRRHRRAYGREEGRWSKLRVTAWAAGLAHRRQWLHYVVVSAIRRRAPVRPGIVETP